MPAKRA